MNSADASQSRTSPSHNPQTTDSLREDREKNPQAIYEIMRIKFAIQQVRDSKCKPNQAIEPEMEFRSSKVWKEHPVPLSMITAGRPVASIAETQSLLSAPRFYSCLSRNVIKIRSSHQLAIAIVVTANCALLCFRRKMTRTNADWRQVTPKVSPRRWHYTVQWPWGYITFACFITLFNI